MVGGRTYDRAAASEAARGSLRAWASRVDRGWHTVDLRGGAIWVLAAVAIGYLGWEGGGYDTTVWGSAGVIICWTALLGALLGFDRVRRPSRVGWVMLGALIGLVAWSAVGMIWSGSRERTLAEVARDATYLGALALAIGGLGAKYARHLIAGVATAIVFIATVALLSRMLPGSFGTNSTNTLLPGVRARLSYPVGYWNALGELVAIGIPLVWSATTQARTRLGQSLAAGTLPALVLTLLLTLSRGSLVALALAALLYLLLAPNRSAQLVTGLLGAAGGALLTVIAFGDHAFREGLATSGARHQGHALLVLTIVVCVAVAAAHFGLSLARRRGVFARLREVALPSTGIRVRPRTTAAAVLLAAVIAFLVAGGPHRLSHAWSAFKRPTPASNQSPARLGSLSGNWRYQYWRESILAAEHHPFRGIGAGTWEFWWTRHGDPTAGYVRNAHSLVFETIAETGIPGGVLILLFLGAALAGTALRARRSPIVPDSASFAAAAASSAAFTVAAFTDWVWQVPVVTLCFLMVAGVALGVEGAPPRRAGIGPRLSVAGATVCCLIAIAIPLEATIAVRRSQAAVAHGSIQSGLRYARTAERIEPYGATPWMQEALVLELAGDLKGAERAARRAQADEPQNWRPPLILARVEAERGRIPQALAAARRALLLNPSLSLL